MSIHTKLILPFINKKLTLKDIAKETGFVDIYTLDINRPYLTSHIFLLYKSIPENEFFDVYHKLSSLDNLHSKKSITINGVFYALFCFTINPTIRTIRKNGLLLLSKDEKLCINDFWKSTDVDVTDFLMGYYYLGEEFKDNVVPEEDFYLKDLLKYDEKRGKLVLSSPL